MKIYVKKWYSKKKDKEYIALMCSNGKREKVLTFDRYIISDYLGVISADLNDMDVGIVDAIDVERCRKE